MSGIRALDSSGARALPEPQDSSPPKRAASRAEDEDDDGGDFDESLGALLNPAKVRSKTTKELEVEAEQQADDSDSSDPNLQRQMEYIIAAQRNKAAKDQPRRRKVPINAEPPPPPPQGGKKKKPSKSPSISSSSSSPQTQSSSGASGEEPSEEEDDDDEEDEPEEETRLERKIRKACEKAKLLARIDQLHESHHIPKTREFTYRASTEELTVEVARMEVLALRGVRVKQGRAAFLYSVMGIEKAMNFSDKQEVLPFNWYMGGFTKEATRSIADYDDALESAVEDLVGPGGRMPWYMQLGFILVPAMAQHSMMQRFKDDPEHTARVLREDPALANRVAEEIARTEIRRRELAAAEAPPPAAPPTRTVAGARPRVQMQPAAAARTAAPALDNRPVPPPLATREETAHMHLTVEAAEQMAKQRAQLQAQEGRMQALERQLAETQERARADRARADAAAAASAALHAEVARAKQPQHPVAPVAAPVAVPVGGIAAALAASRAARAAADDSSSASSSGLDIFVQ